MSPRKTPESPGRTPARPQAEGRENVAPVQSHGARQAKKRTSPKKPRPKSDEGQRKMIARFLLRRLNEDNCERHGVSKLEICRLREAVRGDR